MSAAEGVAMQQFVLVVQNSKLAHTSLQSHFSSDASPVSDILFEGTEAGLAAQEAQLRKLSALASISEAPTTTWRAREELWAFSDSAGTAIAKISILPATLARTMELVKQTANKHELRWKSLMYATGLGWLRLEGEAGSLCGALQTFRGGLQGDGGSLVSLHRPAKAAVELKLYCRSHFGSCPGGMACMTACPSGMDYGKLIEATRPQIEPKTEGPPGENLPRRFMFETFTRPDRLRRMRLPLLVYQKSGLQAVVRELGLLKLLPKKLQALEALLPGVGPRDAVGRGTPAPATQRGLGGWRLS